LSLRQKSGIRAQGEMTASALQRLAAVARLASGSAEREKLIPCSLDFSTCCRYRYALGSMGRASNSIHPVRSAASGCSKPRRETVPAYQNDA
jgi:hypothetical protein